ncbi:MAG: hypothetical protein ACM3NH_03255, partial [Candidatus Saccharibacteria bacterium]
MKNRISKIAAISAFALAVWVVSPASFVYAAPFVTMDNFSGPPGTTIMLSGGGFNSGETVDIRFGDAASPVAASATAGPDSLFGPLAVKVPLVGQGNLPVTATGSVSGLTATNGFYVQGLSPNITVTSDVSTPGGTLSVSGSGFGAGEPVVVSLSGATGNATADSAGAFAGTTLTIPSLAAGTYPVAATGQLSGAMAVSYFYVGSFFPSIAPSAYYLLPGDTLTFSGSGFAPNETIEVFGTSSQSALASFHANAAGSFAGAGGITVPFSLMGTQQTYSLIGNVSKSSAAVKVTIGSFSPQISPSSYYVLPGGSVSFTGSGYAPGETIRVMIGSNIQPAASFTADASGAFAGAGTISVPLSLAGTAQTFTLRGESSGAEAQVMVNIGSFNSQISPSAYFLLPGQTISFSGQGYAGSETINVFTGSQNNQVSTIGADPSGSFQNAGDYKIPYDFANSSRTFTLKGATSGTEAAVTVTIGLFNPNVTPSSYYVHSGEAVTFAGSGFAPGESVNLTEGQNSGVLQSGTADPAGAVTIGPLPIPFSFQAGDHVLHFTGAASGVTAGLTLTVAPFQPLLTPSAYYLKGGDALSVTGTGFSPGESVTVTADGNPQAFATADGQGNISAGPFTAPFSGSGMNIGATGGSSAAQASVIVSLGARSPQVQPSGWYLAPGSAVSFTGTDFAPGETVALS